MSNCSICGSDFTKRNLSDTECFKCKSDKTFKFDISFYMERINHIKETYNFSTQDALSLLSLQTVDDKLGDIDRSISSIYDAVRDL